MGSRLPSSQVGALCEAVATSWLLAQGLHVFRSVQPHGPIDLLALDRSTGEITRYDAKVWARDLRTKTLSPEQQRLGVKLLIVQPEIGHCFVYDPESVGARPSLRERQARAEAALTQDVAEMVAKKALRVVR